MTIVDSLKSPYPIKLFRIEDWDRRWLIWSPVFNEWCVYQQNKGERKPDLICNTKDENFAVTQLLKD